MKMKKIYFLLLLSLLTFNFSCKKDNEEENNQKTALKVEEGKEQLEDNAINILNKIESFKGDKALNEIIDLAEFLTSVPNEDKNTTFNKTALKAILNIAESNKKGIINFNTKQSLALIDEKHLLEDFNEEKGIYEWNNDTETFDKIGNSDDIIYNITYNNGKKAIFSFTDFNTTLSNDEELPTLAKANLKIDNLTVFNQVFTASFSDDNTIPKSIENTITIGDFSFKTSHNNSDNSIVTQSVEIKIIDDVLMSFENKVKGNFSDEEADVDSLLDNVSMTLKFLDATLVITAKDTGVDFEKEYTIDETIVLLNSNTSAELSVNDKSVAKSEFYKDKDTYLSWVYNSSTNRYEEKEITEDIVNVRFLFDDGTTADFDTYFDGSFTKINDKLDAVFEAYENLLEE
jgi:hypothetical protein